MGFAFNGMKQYVRHKMKKEKKFLQNKKKFTWGIIGIAVSVVCIAGLSMGIVPGRDQIATANLPETRFVYAENNYCAYQFGKDCSGYATAYVLRNEGIAANGAEIYQEMHTFFGRVAVHNVVDKLKDYHLEAKAYHGTIETLKARINAGKPVIALVTITLDNSTGLHYLTVVGYDEEYLYVSDSTSPKANIFNVKQYNRRLTYDEFEDLWKTNIYPVNNIYITIE